MCDFAIKRGYKTLGSEFRNTAQKLESARRMRERKMRAMEVSRKNAEMAAAAEGPVSVAIDAIFFAEQRQRILIECPTNMPPRTRIDGQS